MPTRFGHQPPDHVEPVLAAEERHLGLVGQLGRKRPRILSRHVRRIRDHEVEPFVRHGLEEIAVQEANPLSLRQPIGIVRRNLKGRLGKIRRRDVGLGPFRREREGDCTRSGAQIQDSPGAVGLATRRSGGSGS